MASLDELVSELRADGTVDSSGTFTLDREQARAKMQKFQLADARRYVLELVQSACLRGATRIAFYIDADDMRLEFDGLAFEAHEFEDLYGSLFSDQIGPRVDGVRQLAVALNAAMGMNPKFIVVRSGAVSLEMRPGQTDRIESMETPAQLTEVHVRQRFGARVVLDFFRKLAGRLEESVYLRDRCRHAQVRVELGGVPLALPATGARHFPDAMVEVPLSGSEFTGAIGLFAGESTTSLRLVKDGVWIDQRTLPQYGTHLVAVAESSQLRKDVSQAKIVSNATVEAIVEAIGVGRWSLWTRAVEASERDPDLRHRVQAWLREQLLDYAELEALKADPAALALCEQVTWPDARDQTRTVSLAAMIAIREQGDPVRYATRTFSDLPATGAPVALVERRAEANRITSLLGESRDETRSLRRDQDRKQARDAWLQRTSAAELPAHLGLLSRRRFARDRVRGELGVDLDLMIEPALRHPLRASLITQGRLLGRIELDVGVPHLWMAIEADFEPSEDYTDAERDATFAQTLIESLVAFEGAIVDAWRAAVSDEDHANVRGLVKRWLALLLLPGRLEATLTKIGVPEHAAQAARGDALLPRLTLRALGEDPSAIADIPLFLDFEDQRHTLRTIAAQHVEHGQLPFLPWSTQLEIAVPLDGVLRLGIDDERILAAIFGAEGLRPFIDDLADRQARARFLSRPVETAEALRDAIALHLTSVGIDPTLATHPITTGGGRTGFLALVPDPDDFEFDADGELSVYHLQRAIADYSLPLGLSRVLAFVDDPNLTPTEDWDDILEDSRFDDLVAVVHESSLDFVRSLCAHLRGFPAHHRKWVTAALLATAATEDAIHGGRGGAVHQAIRELPLLPTIDRGAISLAAAESILVEHGKLEWVPDDHAWAKPSSPPIVALDANTLARVEYLLGTKLTDGGGRVRLAHHSEALAALPRIATIELQPGHKLVSTTLDHGDVVGEIAIAPTRVDGLELTLCTGGRLVGEIERPLAIPINAILADDKLPLRADAEIDEDHKRIRAMIRRCRRAVPDLMLRLCRSLDQLDPAARLRARVLIIRHAADELSRAEDRREVRDRALAACLSAEILTDVWGKPWTLDAASTFDHGDQLEVIVDADPSDVPGDSAAAMGRLILRVEPPIREALEQVLSVRCLDDQWAQVKRALARTEATPSIERPSNHQLDELAILHRRAHSAGGLEVLLWLPREHGADALQWAFLRGERVLRLAPFFDLVPAAAIVDGVSVAPNDDGVPLDAKQHGGLERQVIVLYNTLADQLEKDRLSTEDRRIAYAYLAHVRAGVAANPDHPALGRLGKRIGALCKRIEQLVPPALREAVREQSLEPTQPVAPPEPEPEPESEPESEPEPESETVEPGSDGPTEAPSQPAPTTTPAPTPPRNPEARLLDALYEQLAWARARHGSLLEEASVGAIRLGDSMGIGIAEPATRALVLRRHHPLVERLLAQDPDQPHDPIDLAFAVSATYTLMNIVSEAISDDDEREFVAHMAEALVLARRARS